MPIIRRVPKRASPTAAFRQATTRSSTSSRWRLRRRHRGRRGHLRAAGHRQRPARRRRQDPRRRRADQEADGHGRLLHRQRRRRRSRRPAARSSRSAARGRRASGRGVTEARPPPADRQPAPLGEPPAGVRTVGRVADARRRPRRPPEPPSRQATSTGDADPPTLRAVDVTASAAARRPAGHDPCRSGPRTAGRLFEKLVTSFRIPELRQQDPAHAAVCWRSTASASTSRCRSSTRQQLAALAEPGRRSGRPAGCSARVACSAAASIGRRTIFGLGIMPYISASIIFQLLGSVVPVAGELSEGRRERAQEDQRVDPLRHRAALHGPELVLVRSDRQRQGLDGRSSSISDRVRLRLDSWSRVLTMTAGTIFLMWLGEQIDEYGIGNGISLLIMAGILARMPDAVYRRCCKSTSRRHRAAAADDGPRRRCSCWRRCSSRWSSA